MNIGPLNHVNKFFSQEEYDYYVSASREHLTSVDTKIIFYKVDKEKSVIDDLYGEAYEEEVKTMSPVEIPALIKFEEPKNKAYIEDKGMLRYEEYGNLVVHLLLADLDALKVEITYGDYVGYRVSETKVIYFQVANDAQKHYENSKTFMGYRAFWKTIVCTPTTRGEEFFRE
jgi:hypothetical protein